MSTVVPIARTEISRVGKTLGRAFTNDPQWMALVPDPEVRPERLELMFEGAVKMVMAAKGAPERTEGFEGAALWVSPGNSLGFGTALRSGFSSATWVFKRPRQNLRRLTATLREFEKAHKRVMSRPHWYLMALGVDPDHHGQGHGSALVRHGLERANHDGTPLYLETETGPNVGFYESLGLEVIEEITIEAIDMPFSLMAANR